MNQPALTPVPMDDQVSDEDARRVYEDLLVRAMHYARRLLPQQQAFEVAHDVAVEMIERSAATDVSGTTLYFAVLGRLRQSWRTAQRRAARDRAYLDEQSAVSPLWARPDSGLEASELRTRIAEAVACMPPAMRETFLLVRQEELSYKEAAERLAVGIGTVHAQLSRANAFLRERLRKYLTDVQRTPGTKQRGKP